MNNSKEVFYLNGFKIVNVNGSWWIGDSNPLCGPLGTIEEARDWCNTHTAKEFETRMFLKTEKAALIANGILERQPNLFKKLAKYS